MIAIDYAYLAAGRQRRRAMPQLTYAGRFWGLYMFGVTVTLITLFGYGYVEAIWKAVVR